MILQATAAEYLVVGAGPAGLTAACLLALKGRKVVVADPGAPLAKRLELLPPSSLRTVAAVGLESLLHDPAIARPCLGIRRQRIASQYDYEDFFSHPYRTGYVINRTRFDERLRRRAAAAGVAFCRLRVTGIEPNGHCLRVRPSSGPPEVLPFAGTIIDATGRAAMIARRQGARVSVRDRLVAELIEETFNDSAADTASWLDYRSDGAGWSYRISGPAGHAQQWRVSRPGKVAGKSRYRVDASSSCLSEAAGQNWIAVGDAAIAFDPIASQGLFNALSSALVASGILMSAEGLNIVSARLYSDIVAATFTYSEFNRLKVYQTDWPAVVGEPDAGLANGAALVAAAGRHQAGDRH